MRIPRSNYRDMELIQEDLLSCSVFCRHIVVGALFGPEGAQWKKVHYGHRANWTQRNAEFAYAETINLLTRLQEANPYPTPYCHEDVFKYVLVVKRDSSEITIMHWDIDGWSLREDHEFSFAAGDRIECRARGSHFLPSDPSECDDDPETSRFVVARDPVSEKLGEDRIFTALIFAREDVEIFDVEISE